MKRKDVGLLVLLAAIWGSSYLFLRIATPVIGPALTMSVRVVLAAAVMLGLFAYLKKFPQYRTYWKEYIVLGVLNLVLPFTLVSYSIAHLNASVGAILNATTPLFTMVVSSLWLKEKICFKKVLGLLLGLTGLTVLVGWIPFRFTADVILSIVFSLLASLSYGVGAVYTKLYLSKAEPIKTATGQTTAAALLVLPFLHIPSSGEVFSLTIVLALVMLAVLCTALGYSLYFKLISRIGSTNTSLVTLLVPVFSLVWATIFLHEPLTPSILIGLLFIITSLKLVLAPAK